MVDYQVVFLGCPQQVVPGIVKNNFVIVIENSGINHFKETGCFNDLGFDLDGGCDCVPAEDTGGSPGAKSNREGGLRAGIGQDGQIPQQGAYADIAEA